MALTPAQAALSIAVMAGVTFLTRFLPFLLFDRGGKPPRIVLYLGRVLPPAIIMMLIIYCLRNVSFTSASHGIPELVCVTVAAALVEREQPVVDLYGHGVVYVFAASGILSKRRGLAPSFLSRSRSLFFLNGKKK